MSSGVEAGREVRDRRWSGVQVRDRRDDVRGLAAIILLDCEISVWALRFWASRALILAHSLQTSFQYLPTRAFRGPA